MKSKIFKYTLLFFTALLLVVGLYLYVKISARLYPRPAIQDSETSIIGFNHVGITVKDLDVMLAFYQSATRFDLLDRSMIQNNKSVNQLYGQDSMVYERAILKGPNMLLELTQFENQQDRDLSKMPPEGPGMTHTCYQSPDTKSGYQSFKKAGIEMLSRGDDPIDLGGYGVTYAYGHDPEGNMVELEQMSSTLIKLQIGSEFAEANPMWMTQVALISPDLSRLLDFYEKVLEIKPYRVGSYKDNPKFDEIGDRDNLAFDAGWFGLDSQGKKLELMQYVNPATPAITTQRKLTDLGYNFSFEVEDIQKEYARLQEHGIEFISEPQKVDDFWSVFAKDPDGNFFSLRQAIDEDSKYSLKNF